MSSSAACIVSDFQPRSDPFRWWWFPTLLYVLLLGFGQMRVHAQSSAIEIQVKETFWYALSRAGQAALTM